MVWGLIASCKDRGFYTQVTESMAAEERYDLHIKKITLAIVWKIGVKGDKDGTKNTTKLKWHQ